MLLNCDGLNFGSSFSKEIVFGTSYFILANTILARALYAALPSP